GFRELPGRPAEGWPLTRMHRERREGKEKRLSPSPPAFRFFSPESTPATMQKQKNLILFLVISAVILFGWFAVQNWLWPNKPPEKKQPAAAARLTAEERQAASAAGLVAASAQPGADPMAAQFGLLANLTRSGAMKPPHPPEYWVRPLLLPGS